MVERPEHQSQNPKINPRGHMKSRKTYIHFFLIQEEKQAPGKQINELYQRLRSLTHISLLI